MDNRKFQSAASATPPTAPGTPSTGYPTNGNPGTGTPATLPGDYWFHQIGEEIRSIIVGAGITPSIGTLNQAWAAIVGGCTFTAASAGFIKLPIWMGSIVIQWGVTGNFPTDSSDVTTSWPTSFATACFQVVLTDNATTTNYAGIKISSTSTTGFTASKINLQGTSTSHNFRFIAIGV